MKAILGLLVMLAPAATVAEDSNPDRATIPEPTLLDCAKAKTKAISIPQGRGAYKVVGICDKVAVTGSMNAVSIEAVKNLSITGSKNEIAVDKVDKVAVLGSLNRVTYSSGLSKAAPKVASIGKGNVVSKAPAPTPRPATK